MKVLCKKMGISHHHAVILITFLLGFTDVISLTTHEPPYAEDLPCASRVGDFEEGYICVCNSTYCDTVYTPLPLSRNQFYHYKTSHTSPGFTKTVGTFYNHTDIDVIDFVFTINSSMEFQEIIGFGGSVTDSSATVVNYLPPDAADKLIKSYFGPQGIEYSMLRIPIGGTDFSDRSYTLDDVPFDEDLIYFKLSDEDNNLKIPAIKRAMTVSQRDIKLLACTWVTPAWMKAGNTNYTGFIADRYQHVWAQYHIKFLQAYLQEGLHFWSLSGNNEAMLQFVYPLPEGMLNSTMMLASEQRLWLKKHLKPLLMANNFTDIKFFGLEDERAFAPYWMGRFASDQEAFQDLDGLALHWYSDFFIPVSMIDEMHQLYPNKTIIYTESSINGEFGEKAAVILGSWYRAEAYLYYIMENLEHWTSAWLDWNFALDEYGGPTLTSALDAAIIVNQTSGEFYKQPTFYAMGHFSKFIPPGSHKVLVSPPYYSSRTSYNGNDAVKERIKAFWRNRTYSSSTVNSGLPSITIPEEVRCLATSNSDDSFSVLVLNTMNVTARVKIEDSRVGVITMDIEEHSVNTFVYWP